MTRHELTVKSSAAERYDTDLIDRVETVLRDLAGVRYLYSEGGRDLTVDRSHPDGADNHFVFAADPDGTERAQAAVEALTGRIPTLTALDDHEPATTYADVDLEEQARQMDETFPGMRESFNAALDRADAEEPRA